ncbi:MAG: hypothetical protein L0Y35_00410, partial [Flammeovirgaceae bacterium]|nr:hypothetical protein [Flammeovirgaceae bacterium]
TIVGLYLFPSSLIGPLGGRALALIFAFVWVVSRIVGEFGLHFNLSLLGESFKFNLYLFIYQLQQWVINYADRILMLLYLPLASVGIYDFAVKCLVGIELFMNGLHSAFVPKVMKLITIGKEGGSSPEVNRYYNGFIATMMIVICGSIFLVPLVIEWLSDYLQRPEYKLTIRLMPFLALLFLIRSIRLYFGLPYTILKYTKPLPFIYLIVATLKIGGVVLLADSMDTMGVIVASAVSFVSEVVLLYVMSKNRFQFRFNTHKVLIAPLILLTVIVVSELSLQLVNEVIRHFAYCVLCVFLLLITYRSELKQIKISSLVK